MGQERACKLEYNGSAYEGKALLETKELIFRGETRLKIPFDRIRSVESQDGQLRVLFPPDEATFHLGDAAAKWAAKILNPPGRLDKLGVGSGARLRWIGKADAGFKKEAEGRGAQFVRSQADMTFIAASDTSALEQLASIGGPVWVIYPKGVKQIREADVLNAGRAAGLTDVKVASFSDTQTALKFVPRKTERK